MDSNREHFRAMIFYDFKVGLTQLQCVDRIRLAFGDEAPTRATVYNWFSAFNRGRSSLADEFLGGRQLLHQKTLMRCARKSC